MASIRSQMVLNDGISGVLRKINTALNTTLNAFEQVQRASGNAVDTAQIQAARAALAEANREVDNMAEGYRRAAQQEEVLNRGLRNGASAADGMLGRVKSLVATLAAGAGIKAILGMSDKMTSTSARLSFLVDDGGSVDALEQKIMASAQRSRAAYLDTASAIASMGANAGSAFSDNDELIAFMEQVNKQFVIGGATAEGQSAAMLQLTQAMAAGALRGEELNSILENAPGIARAIESYMGVAEGSIKQYAEQGLITSEVVKNALFSVADETNAKFESMPMTWAQVWTTMQNKALSIFDPILARINQVANSERFSTVTDGVISGLAGIAAVAGVVLDLLISGGALVVDNWSWISPIVWGLVAAFLAYNTVALITNGINGAMALAEGVKADEHRGHLCRHSGPIRAQCGPAGVPYYLDSGPRHRPCGGLLRGRGGHQSLCRDLPLRDRAHYGRVCRGGGLPHQPGPGCGELRDWPGGGALQPDRHLCQLLRQRVQ